MAYLECRIIPSALLCKSWSAHCLEQARQRADSGQNVTCTAIEEEKVRKVNGLNIPETPDEYEVWRDEHNRLHFRVKGSVDDMLLKGWSWEDEAPDNKHRGMVHIRRYDVINRKHKSGFCSPHHPLVIALGLVKP